MKPGTPSYSVKLAQLDVLNPSVKMYHLEFSKPFVFESGQFVMIHLDGPDGKEIKRAYSIASAPKLKNKIELCIRRVPGGTATTMLDHLKAGDTLKISGPLGKFTLDEKVKNDLVLIAGGTGIAPIRSMLHTLPVKDLKHNITLYFGINTLGDYLFQEELKKFEGLKNFKLVLVVADDPQWKGEKGYITEAVMKKQTPDLANTDIYMCGPPLMIRSIKAFLPNLGAKPEKIHIDAWE